MTEKTSQEEKAALYEKHMQWKSIHQRGAIKKRPPAIGNPNHPKKGEKIKVEPIRSKSSIRQIKENLRNKPRDLAIFTLGINTAYRAKELLSLNVRDVKHLKHGDTLDIYQTKTKKYRRVALNPTVIKALQDWIEFSQLDSEAPLFMSNKGGNALSVPSLNALVKKWCRDAGLVGNYGSHTLRKTWGYWQRVDNNTAIPLLMRAYGHTTEQQTLDYLGIQSSEISALYDYEL